MVMNINRSIHLPTSKNEFKEKNKLKKKTNLSQENAFGVKTANEVLKCILTTTSLWSIFFIIERITDWLYASSKAADWQQIKEKNHPQEKDNLTARKRLRRENRRWWFKTYFGNNQSLVEFFFIIVWIIDWLWTTTETTNWQQVKTN